MLILLHTDNDLNSDGNGEEEAHQPPLGIVRRFPPSDLVHTCSHGEGWKGVRDWWKGLVGGVLVT